MARPEPFIAIPAVVPEDQIHSHPIASFVFEGIETSLPAKVLW
jgi:hypothetical protein